jgi:arginine exporter protein ArgO
MELKLDEFSIYGKGPSWQIEGQQNTIFAKGATLASTAWFFLSGSHGIGVLFVLSFAERLKNGA